MKTALEAYSRRAVEADRQRYRVAIVTSIHADFDVRIWKHARAVRDMGHEVHVVCPWEVPDGCLHEGIRFHTFPRVRTRARRIWQVPIRVLGKALLLLRRVDLLHFHDIDILPFMALVRPWRPVVYDVHENYPEEMMVRSWVPSLLRRPLSFLVHVAQRVFSRAVRNVVLTSHYQEERDFRSDRLNKLIIRNYASLKLMQDVTPDYRARPDAVVFLGVASIPNGSLVLLEVAEAIHRRHGQVRFYCSGRFWDAGFRDGFMAERKKRGLEDVLSILPFVPAHLIVREILNKATIGLSPNLRIRQQIRGAHAKLYEYMAAGLPIVASDLPDQAETVEGNNAGLLARPEEPDTFVAAIERLIQDRELAYRLGRNGQEAFLRKYSWESQMPALEAYYRSILSGTDSGR